MSSMSRLNNTAVTAPGSASVTDIPMTRAVLPARSNGLRRLGCFVSAACLSIPLAACGTIQRSPTGDAAIGTPVAPVDPAIRRVWQESSEAQAVAGRLGIQNYAVITSTGVCTLKTESNQPWGFATNGKDTIYAPLVLKEKNGVTRTVDFGALQAWGVEVAGVATKNSLGRIVCDLDGKVYSAMGEPRYLGEVTSYDEFYRSTK
jgi:hypothetical protein